MTSANSTMEKNKETFWKLSSDEVPSFISNKLGIDDVADRVKEAGLSGSDMMSLSRDDIYDLMSEPRFFTSRMKLWKLIKSFNDSCEITDSDSSSNRSSSNSRNTGGSTPSSSQGTSSRACSSSFRATPKNKDGRSSTVSSPIMVLDHVEFPIFIDVDLAHAAKTGGAISEGLRNRLVRNTIATMRSQTHSLDLPREPNASDIDAMAKKLVQNYPPLRDDPGLNAKNPWKGLANQLKRRLSNVKPVCKPQGNKPQRSKRKLPLQANIVPEKKASIQSSVDLEDETTDIESQPESLSNSSSDEDGQVDSNTNVQSRHYEKLKELSLQKRPNLKVVGQLMDLEFSQRRKYISTLNVTLGEKVSMVIGQYPALKNADQCMEEVRRLVDLKNKSYVEERLNDLTEFWTHLLFYGLHKKVHGPPDQLNEDTKCLTVLQNLTQLFPSSKSKRSKGLSLLRELKNEDLDKTVKSTKDPVMLLKDDEILIVVHGHLLFKIGNRNWCRGLFGLMAVYYVFELPYPGFAETVLSVIQTELLHDNIHIKDQTKEYKAAVKEFREFLNK